MEKNTKAILELCCGSANVGADYNLSICHHSQLPKISGESW